MGGRAFGPCAGRQAFGRMLYGMARGGHPRGELVRANTGEARALARRLLGGFHVGGVCLLGVFPSRSPKTGMLQNTWRLFGANSRRFPARSRRLGLREPKRPS